MYQVKRYHDISTGHRVVGHENKCKHLHGHNYRVHFTCIADNKPKSREIGIPKVELDNLGRVIDFGVVKEKLCMWLEDNWDHKFLHWEKDPLIDVFKSALKDLIFDTSVDETLTEYGLDSFIALPFNPTAENMAQYLVEVIGPQQLKGTGVKLSEVLIEETAKCHVSYIA